MTGHGARGAVEALDEGDTYKSGEEEPTYLRPSSAVLDSDVRSMRDSDVRC